MVLEVQLENEASRILNFKEQYHLMNVVFVWVHNYDKDIKDGELLMPRSGYNVQIANVQCGCMLGA